MATKAVPEVRLDTTSACRVGNCPAQPHGHYRGRLRWAQTMGVGISPTPSSSQPLSRADCVAVLNETAASTCSISGARGWPPKNTTSPGGALDRPRSDVDGYLRSITVQRKSSSYRAARRDGRAPGLAADLPGCLLLQAWSVDGCVSDCEQVEAKTPQNGGL
jgi:hypothetical protein